MDLNEPEMEPEEEVADVEEEPSAPAVTEEVEVKQSEPAQRKRKPRKE